MNGSQHLLALVIVAAAASVGCDGASSARERNEVPPASQAADEPADAAVAPVAGTTPTAGGAVEATFDDIKFPMEKTDDFVESMLTDQVKSLFGRRIRIRGYMYPTPRRTGNKQFVLVRDNMECCFGPGAALFDCILVTMKGGATAEFSLRPIAVEGEFLFEPRLGPEGRPLAIYQMAGESVE